MLAMSHCAMSSPVSSGFFLDSEVTLEVGTCLLHLHLIGGDVSVVEGFDSLDYGSSEQFFDVHELYRNLFCLSIFSHSSTRVWRKWVGGLNKGLLRQP